HHTSASSSQDHCHASLSVVDINCQTSPSPDTDQSDMTSPTEGTPAIASASVLETTKAPQSRLGFLSLPPEIRNMIYSFLFTPVQDGTCWGVRAKFMDASLSGCIFNLASPVHDSFNQFLVNMGSPTGAYLAGLSCTSYDGGEPNYKPDCYRSLSTFINEKRIKIGHLELKECWVSDYKPISMLEFFVDFLQSLDHKPATVRWQKSDFESDPSYKGEMDALNNVVGTWLEATSIAKAKRSNLKMPALRDFLPQYFDQPQI
ncbi:hypothetical protein D6D25_09377, partial [Aureobasidium pullulans]